MDDLFSSLLEEARSSLEGGKPFWCSDLLRPRSTEFTDCLRDNGFDVYCLYFMECDENVYSPMSFLPEELKNTAIKRAELRSLGAEESNLPNCL